MFNRRFNLDPTPVTSSGANGATLPMLFDFTGESFRGFRGLADAVNGLSAAFNHL